MKFLFEIIYINFGSHKSAFDNPLTHIFIILYLERKYLRAGACGKAYVQADVRIGANKMIRI